MEWLKKLHNPEALIELLREWNWVAYVVLFGIIFAETGLLVGFFFPGDSLLFVAGFAASETMQILNIWILIPLLFVAAVVGDTVGFWLGRYTGPKIFKKEKSFFFNPAHIAKTERYFERYGGKTIIVARFVPIVRTFAPFMAGVGNMEYKKFISFNVFGGLLWVVSMPLLGYYLGNIPVVKANLEKAVLGVVFLSVLPIIFELVREKLRPHDPKEEVIREELNPEDFS